MPSGRFKTTVWTVILAAKGQGTASSQEALETLCETYWGPLYSYIRHCGYRTEEALDLTQEFFRRFLEEDFLKDVDQSKGRFRSFLLVCVRHFLSREREKSGAQKRGGALIRIELNPSEAEPAIWKGLTCFIPGSLVRRRVGTNAYRRRDARS